MQVKNPLPLSQLKSPPDYRPIFLLTKNIPVVALPLLPYPHPYKHKSSPGGLSKLTYQSLYRALYFK